MWFGAIAGVGGQCDIENREHFARNVFACQCDITNLNISERKEVSINL